MFLIDNAFAQDAAAPGAGSSFLSLLPIFAIFIIFYFFLIRPQHKKLKEHRGMVEALKRGDKVITSGGIVGTISRIEEGFADIEIAPNVKVKVVKSTISEIYTKTPEQDKKDNPENQNKAA